MHLSLLLALLPVVLGLPSSARRAEPAEIKAPSSNDLIADKYIVKFRDGSSLSAVDEAIRALKQDADHVFDTVLKGFSGSIDAGTLEKLRHHPDIDYIEQDFKVYATEYVTQEDADWGLARISSDDINTTAYTYDESAGEGTCSWIMDTGINADHEDFGGRAKMVKSFVYNSNIDDNGHGTYTAGIVGSNTWGVAKKTQLFGIKVLNEGGAGSGSDIMAAMDWLAKDSKTRHCPKGKVVNMSFGGGYSEASNVATNNLAKAGVFVAAAAGNGNEDVRDFSPASADLACSVGASNKYDQRASFSNYGSSMDIFAPGVDITSTSFTGGNATATASGTSAAAPFVAGLGAYFSAYKGIKSSHLCSYIQKHAQDKIVLIPDGTTSMLINNGAPKL